MMFNKLCIGSLVSLLLLSNLHADNTFYRSDTIDIAAFGDSITRGWPYHKNDVNGLVNNGGYVPSLQSQLNTAWTQIAGVTVYNYGHPGEYIVTEGRTRILDVLDEPVRDYEYMLIMEGTNDLALGFGPGTVFDKLARAIDDVADSGTEPVIGTLLRRYDEHSDKNAEIVIVNDNLKNLASEDGHALADLYNASYKWENKSWSNYMPDGLHPNTAGYGIMANEWFDALQTVAPENPIVVAPMLFMLLLSD